MDDERDYAEEAYWRDYCQPCGASPCNWDGKPDGFHADRCEGCGQATSDWRDVGLFCSDDCLQAHISQLAMEVR